MHFIYIKSHLDGFKLPGSSFDLMNIENDPRLFVFLRQQIDNENENTDILHELIHSLILYSLENTDPDKNIVCSKDEILAFIHDKYKQNPNYYTSIVDDLLQSMIQKPREIQFHSKLHGYCLPYETRERIKLQNANDISLYNAFADSLHKRIQERIPETSKQIISESIINKVFHKIFYIQGLEFADFILNAANQEAFEKELSDIISEVIFKERINRRDAGIIQQDCQVIIRDIVYRGNTVEKLYISKLSKTYLMMFLLRFDPKISNFFSLLEK